MNAAGDSMQVRSCPRNHARECRTAGGSVLCDACISQVQRNLRTLPALYDECLRHAQLTSRRSNPTRVSGSRTRDHLNVSVLDARYNILATLESWAEAFAEELDVAVPARSVTHLTHFLTRHLEWLASQPLAADFADEMEILAAELRGTIDPESNDLRTAIRKCVVDDCSGTINTSLTNSGRAPRGSIACSAGHFWEMNEWLHLRHLMEQQRKRVTA
jgi:hypothetical protein